MERQISINIEDEDLISIIRSEATKVLSSEETDSIVTNTLEEVKYVAEVISKNPNLLIKLLTNKCLSKVAYENISWDAYEEFDDNADKIFRDIS